MHIHTQTHRRAAVGQSPTLPVAMLYHVKTNPILSGTYPVVTAVVAGLHKQSSPSAFSKQSDNFT